MEGRKKDGGKASVARDGKEVAVFWCCRGQQRACRMARRLQQKSSNTLGMPNRKGLLQRDSVRSWRGRQFLCCQNEKRQSYQPESRGYETGECHGRQELYLSEKEQGQGGSME